MAANCLVKYVIVIDLHSLTLMKLNIFHVYNHYVFFIEFKFMPLSHAFAMHLCLNLIFQMSPQSSIKSLRQCDHPDTLSGGHLEICLLQAS